MSPHTVTKVKHLISILYFDFRRMFLHILFLTRRYMHACKNLFVTSNPLIQDIVMIDFCNAYKTRLSSWKKKDIHKDKTMSVLAVTQ